MMKISTSLQLIVFCVLLSNVFGLDVVNCTYAPNIGKSIEITVENECAYVLYLLSLVKLSTRTRHDTHTHTSDTISRFERAMQIHVQEQVVEMRENTSTVLLMWITKRMRQLSWIKMYIFWSSSILRQDRKQEKYGPRFRKSFLSAIDYSFYCLCLVIIVK